MRLLLDTHALLWSLLGDGALSAVGQSALANADNDVFVSAASAWEASIKHKLGKLPSAGQFLADLDGIVARQGFTELPVSIRHGERAGSLPLLHRDPFDRMLVAQAIEGKLVLVSNDAIFDRYGVARLW